MRFATAVLFIVGLVVGFADVGSKLNCSTWTFIYANVMTFLLHWFTFLHSYKRANSEILNKIATGLNELLRTGEISLPASLVQPLISALHGGKGVGDTLSDILYSLVLFLNRKLSGVLGGAIDGIFN